MDGQLVTATVTGKMYHEMFIDTFNPRNVSNKRIAAFL